MTPESQRIALAEWDGWTELKVTDKKLLGLVPDSKMMDSQGADYTWLELPDYLSDLNSVHELEKKLTDKQHFAFRLNLKQVVPIMGLTSDQHARNYYSATAAQRCEAILRTLNLWKD